MSNTFTILFAVAGAVAVGNLYWAQPLLSEIAASLGISAIESGVLITATQLGYATGVLLLVPLGDAVNRRCFVPLVMGASVLALLVTALAPSYWALLCGLTLVGLTSFSAQVLVPLASDLARDDQRGRVIGTIASGIMIGVMLSRLVSGLVADLFGWRSIYVAAALINVLLAVVLSRKLPDDLPRPMVRYDRLLLSIVQAVRSSPVVRATLVIAASCFAVFIMLWTGLTFLLSAPPFSFTPSQIGLVNLVGLVGAFGAQRLARLHDIGRSTLGTGLALVVILVALGAAAAGSTSIWAIAFAMLFAVLAIQTQFMLSQTRLLTIRPELRSRLNTALIVCNFVAGAVGSSAAGYLWQAGGWPMLMAGQAAIIAFALAVWLANRRALLAVEIKLPQPTCRS